MARRGNKHLRTGKRFEQPRPLSGAHATSAYKSGERWVVRTVPGASATKPYTCPACGRPIGVGVAHVVAWPETPAWGLERAVEARRHWHTGCWNRLT